MYMASYTLSRTGSTDTLLRTISLCLGRPPSLPEMPYHPDCLRKSCAASKQFGIRPLTSLPVDHADDDEIWRPFYTGELEDAYPATKGYRTLTFSWFCRLAVVSFVHIHAVISILTKLLNSSLMRFTPQYTVGDLASYGRSRSWILKRTFGRSTPPYQMSFVSTILNHAPFARPHIYFV